MEALAIGGKFCMSAEFVTPIYIIQGKITNPKDCVVMFDSPNGSEHPVRLTYDDFTLPDGKNMRFGVAVPEWPKIARRLTVVTMGRTNYIKMFLNTARELVDREFLVLIPALPNQDLTDRFLKGKKRQRDYVPSIDYYVRCMDAFDEGVVKGYRDFFGPQLNLSLSMGSLVNTEWMAKQAAEDALEDKVAAAILKAPPYGFTTKPMRKILTDAAMGLFGRQKSLIDSKERVEISPFIKALSRIFVSVGLGKTYAWGQTDYNPEDPVFLHELLTLITNDNEYIEQVKKDLNDNEDLVVGDVTWRTLYAMIQSIERLHRSNDVEKITTPTLFAIGEYDELTPPRLTEDLRSRFPNGSTAIIPGALHDLQGQKKPIRKVMWEEYFDPFLEEYMPVRRAPARSLYEAAQ
jgi:alpha-beta hydrolase superfamily lysophospholipase